MEIFEPSLPGLLWVLAIGLSAIVADVFFETEILSVAALLGISIYLSLLVDVPIQWRVLLVLLCWLVVTGLFYLVWKRFMAPLIRSGFARGIDESVNTAVGSTGILRRIDGKVFVYWNGDLWPIDETEENRMLEDQAEVLISSVEGGVFTVAPATTNR